MSKPKPTGSELQILQVLWEIGPATVRQVHESLESGNTAQYTTTLKLMQIMTEKGLVTRDENQRAHVYHAAIARDETQGRLVRDLMDRVFGGSAAQLVMRALSEKKVSKKELAELKAMLQRYEEGRK